MLPKIRETIARLFRPYEPVQAGVYSTQIQLDSPIGHRLHLRVEKNGDGLLILDASTVLHLNRTAAEFCYYWIRGLPDGEIARLVSTRYKISQEKASQDFVDLKERLNTLIQAPDLDPVTFLEFERISPHSTELSAPLRLDCALTYRTIDEAQPGSVPVERVKRELLTREWKSILKKAWDAGVPHVIFTGGEPTLRPDLPELVAYAEELGMVSGVLSNGWRFTELEYMHDVLNAGLDHLMIILDPDDESAWEALRDTLAEDLFVAVHLTITPHNHERIPAVIEKLAQQKVKGLSLSVADPSLKDNLDRARDLAAHHQLPLIWDIPVPYSAMNPVALELQAVNEATPGAGRAWLYVEPDGDVLPGQGIIHVLGNLLNDPFEVIWEKAQQTG
jgi:organic radical activating enzyme